MKIDLIQGDCLEILDNLRFQGIDFNDCIFVSDPPFNIGYKYKSYKDNKDEGEYYEWLQDIFGNFPKAIIHYPEYLYRFAFQVGEFPEKVISWVYNSNTAKQHRDIAFFGVKPDMTKVGQPYKNPKDKRIKKELKKVKWQDFMTGGK